MSLEKSRFNHLMSNSLEIQYLLTSFNPQLTQRSTCLILKTNIFKALLQIFFLSGPARLLGLERAVLQPLFRRGVHRPGGRHCLPVLRGDDHDDDCDAGDNGDNDGDDGHHRKRGQDRLPVLRGDDVDDDVDNDNDAYDDDGGTAFLFSEHTVPAQKSNISKKMIVGGVLNFFLPKDHF